MEEISAHLFAGQLILLESATYPGSTEEMVLLTLEKSGLRCPVSPCSTEGSTVRSSLSPEVDFFPAFSPEREDPGNRDFLIHQISNVVGGVSAPCALVAQDLYQQVVERTVLVSCSRAAEMTGLLENIYRCVNIALANELKLLCLQMGTNIWEVTEAAKTKPFGFTAFHPGPGLGDHCIPIEPLYLTWKLRDYNCAACPSGHRHPQRHARHNGTSGEDRPRTEETPLHLFVEKIRRSQRYRGI